MWTALQSAMQDTDERRSLDRAVIRRVLGFARPHARTIAGYLALATMLAVVGVAIPVLAGQVVDAIVSGRAESTVLTLALVLAGAAVLEAGIGLLERLASSTLGESLILDLRRAV